MKGSYLELTYIQVLASSSLVFINSFLSLILKLELEKSFFIASLKMVVQLCFLGLILDWVFTQNNPFIVFTIVLIMTIIAANTSVSRIKKVYKGIKIDSFLSIFFGAWSMCAFMIFFINKSNPWYAPTYIIPLMGMTLGNSFSSISITTERFTESLIKNREKIETYLSLGATKFEACRESMKEAINAGMRPNINSMMAAGIVNIPGMMTGQVLSGIDPFNAVKYQIIIFFLIFSGAFLGSIISVFLTYQKVFNHLHQFNYRLIYDKK